MSSVKRMTVAYTSSKELTTRTTPGGATAVSEQMEHTLILIHEGLILESLSRLIFKLTQGI
jgi:hypothetical protein